MYYYYQMPTTVALVIRGDKRVHAAFQRHVLGLCCIVCPQGVLFSGPVFKPVHV